MQTKKHLTALKAFTYVLFGSLAVAPVVAYAQTSKLLEYSGASTVLPHVAGLGTNSIGSIAASIISTIMLLLGLVMVVLIIYAGILWMTAQGESDKIDKAKKTMNNAAIGLMLVVSSMSIANYISGIVSDATGSNDIDQLFTAEEAGLGNVSPEAVVVNVAEAVLGLLSLIAVGLVLYAGFLWMTAAGDEDKVDKAKKIMRNSLIGLLILLSAIGVTNYITTLIVDVTRVEAGVDYEGDPD